MTHIKTLIHGWKGGMCAKGEEMEGERRAREL